ncbi:MAG: c-type cytochrome [Candidatus Rokubacteria bacterium]|nr:c-type cytochrome [Candidatus Rokubacteria bacterium]
MLRRWRSWRPAGFLVVPALSALVGWALAEAAAPASDREVAAGRALYVTLCVVCHGESGRGDGASAAGFATKPSDLTDGRLMNPLPDEFLVNVIRSGGPAEGLSPGMPPFAAYLGPAETRQVVAYLRSIARPPFRPGMAKPIVAVPGAPAQPVFFSHLIHAGSFQIGCQYCHADARRSDYAGLPSVERCMGCHKIVGAQDNPEVLKLHDYWRRGASIPWVRVFKVPEFTYFPHKPHVRAGVECQTCHGPIERMRVVGADTGPALSNDLMHLVGLNPPSRPLTMGWCVDCHRAENARRGTKAPLDCIACHH